MIDALRNNHGSEIPCYSDCYWIGETPLLVVFIDVLLGEAYIKLSSMRQASWL